MRISSMSREVSGLLPGDEPTGIRPDFADRSADELCAEGDWVSSQLGSSSGTPERMSARAAVLLARYMVTRSG